MATKTLNARLTLKIDTLANWQTANPIPLNGEMCLVVVPASAGVVPQEPAMLFKYGDGSTAFNDLPFGSAKAADVYDWAKAATKPAYTADEISGLADYIAGEIQDSNTTYKLVKVDDYNYKLQSKELNGTWADVAGSSLVIPKYDDTALAGRVTDLEGLVGETSVAAQISAAIAALKLSETYDAKGAAAQALVDAKAYADGKDAAIAAAKKAGDDAQSAVDTLAGKVGAVEEGKTVVQMISEAKAAATYDDTALSGRVTTAEGKLTTLIGEDAGKSARAISAEEVAKVVAGADASYDTLKEIADWISSHKTDAASMNSAIVKLEGILAGIGGDGEQATVVAYVTDAIDALKIGDYAKAADLTALAARVTALEGKSHEHANKTVLDGISSEKVAAWDAAEQNAKDHADGLNTAMDTRMGAAEGKLNTLTGADTVEGSVAKALKDAKAYTDELDGELAAIAKSGNVNDLVQTAGDYLVINCGTASTVI